MRGIGASFWVAVALFSTSASAAPPSSSEAAQQPATVTVEAQRRRELIQKQISTYVSAIAMPNRGEALLRWQSPVCPAVMGLSAAEGEFLLERLSKFAMDAGAPVAPKDCGPNLLVIVSPEPTVLTDYVTLISLAQIREDPNPGAAPTILHLFTDKGTTRPEGLSDWDQSFLEALYTSNTESVMQLAVIKDRLYGDLARTNPQ